MSPISRAPERCGPTRKTRRRLPRPRLGFYGVIDERLDIELIAAVAAMRPEWQLVMVGPVVKIDPAVLPRRANIHWLGPKLYEELPLYLAGWDVALMPFARNESTRFISPTKTPEYLAAGRPVVSTPITDVVRSYGEAGLARIAETPEDFVVQCEAALRDARQPRGLARQGGPRARPDVLGFDLRPDARADAMRGLSPARAETSAPAAQRAEARAVPHRVAYGTPGSPSLTRRAGFDYLIVGAGFAGSVLAERLAAGSGQRVLLIDRRPHIGGNAFDHYNDDGILVHRYGPHIFHTNAPHVAAYLSRFTRWRPYEHRVLAQVDGMLVPIPINLTTINRLYGLSLGPAEVEAFLAARAEPVACNPHLRGRGGEQGRARALREVLPRLHAQAVGHGPVRARQGGDLAGADADQHRRPLLRRQLPEHAAARLHADVREHARPSQHQDHAQRRLPGDRARGALRPADLHRADRRVFRLPLRQAALPLAALSPRDARPGALPAGGGRELSRPKRCRIRGSPSTST